MSLRLVAWEFRGADYRFFDVQRGRNACLRRLHGPIASLYLFSTNRIPILHVILSECVYARSYLHFGSTDIREFQCSSMFLFSKL